MTWVRASLPPAPASLSALLQRLHPTTPIRHFSEAAHSKEKTPFAAESIPLRTGRARLVVLGTGWAAARLLRDIDPKVYDLTVSCSRTLA